ncbi:MAG: transposase [Kiritimatiellaeota bacterium]|nr:transposase [Kiritimatiellota bacterium]
MPQSISYVYVHITFGTKHRQPLIDDNIKPELWTYMGGICKALECNPIRVGGHHDHTHICCLLSKKIPSVKLLEEVKRESSKWMKKKGPQYNQFYWQDGYGEFSVNPSELEKVVTYIDGQGEHHKKRTFQSEFLAF